MKLKEALTITFAALMLVSVSAAVVGHDGTGEGPQITSGEEKTIPPEDVYNIDLNRLNETADITEETIEITETSVSGVSFEGKIKAGTPCHELKYNSTKSGDTIKLDIYTESGDRPCVQRVTMIEYNGTVKAIEPFKLEISQRGEKLAEARTENYPRKGLLDKLLGFLRSLF